MTLNHNTTNHHHTMPVLTIHCHRCLTLSKKAFEKLLGPLQQVMDIDQRDRERRIVPSFNEVTHINDERSSSSSSSSSISSFCIPIVLWVLP